MEYLFQTILQLSFYGSIAILIVMLFRLATKKLPKQISCILWVIAGLRLICPFSFRSPLSVLNLHFLQKYSNTTELFHPTANPHAHNVPEVTQAGQALENVTTASTMVSTNDAVQATSSISMFKIMAIVWFVVMVLLFTYTVLKTIHAAYKLRDSERLSRHVYISDQINSPFVLGIFSPKIYMPLGLSKNEWDYLYLHERTHLDKLDHITKLFAISILYVHWFNPLVWIAFNMLCNDIEMRCDEEVLRSKGPDAKREYSLMLVNYASKSEAENYQVIPVGFAKKSLGGIEIKTRVKNIIHYKRTPKV
ncbi:MAG: M56 family metallopeptidase, partial [Clostridia bacterium]|nr:M56 family metallopeptidase [Clostridia bacterium]